jgi:carbon-monoxide dehydrogenase large subunit
MATTTLRTSPEVCGMGHSMKRKEDPRFLRGQGRYVDDIKLPGMLHMDIVRSPYAHAKILAIHTEKALAIPGVLAVITGETLKAYNLHWMPTLMSDTQMVLPVEKVMYQAQEVAAVIATDRYIAADGVDAVEVEYEPLPVVVDPYKALEPGAPVLRDDKEGKTDNHIWHWETGDRAATERAFAEADVTVKQDIYIPRIHVASIETCGCVADFNKTDTHLTVYMTTQAPHAIRTVIALVAGHVGLSEEKIRVISPDLGGGFGGKVPVYPGYVIAVAASVVIGKPIKWVEDRMENLQADSFARDYHMTAELAARKDGTMTALRIKTLADHGYADAAANPSKYPAGLFSICTGSYDIKTAFTEMDAAYTNKPPGGVAYRCSFRVTEAVHAIERVTDVLAQELKMDPAELRFKNFIQADKFPYKSALGWEYDSGDYKAALEMALDRIGYAELRKEQAEKREKGELMGIGICRSPRSWAPGRRRTSTSWASRCSTRRRSASIPPARRSPASAPSRRARDTRRPTPRSSPRSWESRRRTSRSRRGTPTPPPMASAPTPAARRRPPAPPRRWRRGRSATRRRRSPPICWR